MLHVYRGKIKLSNLFAKSVSFTDSWFYQLNLANFAFIWHSLGFQGGTKEGISCRQQSIQTGTIENGLAVIANGRRS